MDTSTIDQLKADACAVIDRRADDLVALSRDLHDHPELAYEEVHAHDRLSDLLASAGLAVQRQACGLDTAFVARAGSAGRSVGVICEYDALPGLGHACGHNIIAAAGAGAGVALAELAGVAGGQVVVLGTPAEEGGGGKVHMIERGAFEGLDAAMMVHPAGSELATMETLANSQLRATYRGVAAHAAAAPHKGVNALDGAVAGYTAVAALRQHIGDAERIHGVFTHGGDKPNIVPDRAETAWWVRSPTLDGLDALDRRVRACLEAGALGAGCEVEITVSAPTYADMVVDADLLAAYVANAARLGRIVEVATPDTAVRGSTDMGNVSHVVPSIHPMVKVAPADVAIHTPAFADCAASADADRAVIDGAKVMAMTAIDVWTAGVDAGGGEVRRSDGPRA